MRLVRPLALLATTLALVPACASPVASDDATPPPDDAASSRDTGVPADGPPESPPDATPAVDGGAPPDATATTDASSDARTPDGSLPTTRAGQIGVLQLVTGVTQESALVYEIPGGDRCATRAVDPCQIVICPRTGNPSATAVSAGDIALTGGAGARVTLAATASGGYLPASQSAPPWAPGERVTVTAAGASVPAFSTAFTYPSPVAITAPMPDIAYQIPLDRAAGLRVAWTPLAHGEALVRLQQNHVDGTVVIACYFPGASGSGTVPPGALGDLLPDPSARSTAATFYGTGRQSVTAGDYQVTVAAESMTLAVNVVVR